MGNEPTMSWVGNLIHIHRAGKSLSATSTPFHNILKSFKSLKTQAEITFPNEVKSMTFFSDKVKNALESPSVAHHFSPRLTKPFLHQVWEIYPRSKVSQSWKRSIKLIFHDNLGGGLLWYFCTALCVAEPWPILIPDILWSIRQVTRHKMFLGFLKFSSLVT